MATGVPLRCACGHNITVHWVDAGGCQKCDCRGYQRPAEPAEGAWVTSYPKQIGEARLMELTPELRAHYACPADIDCGHPECQP